MMRTRTEDRSEEYDTRHQELERKGEAITRKHEEVTRYHDEVQREFNVSHKNLTRSGNPPYLPEMVKLANEQINFDYATKQQLENHYEREKNLRNEAFEAIRSRRRRIYELVQEALQEFHSKEQELK